MASNKNWKGQVYGGRIYSSSVRLFVDSMFELLYFTCKCICYCILLSWTKKSEKNNWIDLVKKNSIPYPPMTSATGARHEYYATVYTLFHTRTQCDILHWETCRRRLGINLELSRPLNNVRGPWWTTDDFSCRIHLIRGWQETAYTDVGCWPYFTGDKGLCPWAIDGAWR